MKRYLSDYRIAIASIIVLIFTWAMKTYLTQSAIEQKSYNSELSKELSEASSLQRVWASNASIPQRLDLIKRKFSSTKIKSFQKSNKSLSATFVGLNISELEYIINEIANLPIQIKNLDTESTPNGYNVRLVLKW